MAGDRPAIQKRAGSARLLPAGKQNRRCAVVTALGRAAIHKGLEFTNVFQGRLSGTSVTGDWADVPRGRTLNSGTLTLNVSRNQLQLQTSTGGFGASLWERTGPARLPTDIFTIFDRVKKNQNAWRDHSLLDNLKPAKGKPVAIFGNIVPSLIPPKIVITSSFPLTYVVIPASSDPDPMHVNYGKGNGRGYNDFICLDGNDSPPDGDIDFNILVDRTALDAQILFWSDGWERSTCPRGHTKFNTVPFPRWVPPDIRRVAERLSEEEARVQLG